MIIEKIKLKNFKQYIDQEINFAHNGKNFTVLKGENGTGKTNLLNAITWCFYGKELHLTEKYDTYPILNTKVAEEMDNGDTTQVEVKIYMKDDGKAINFERTLFFKKKDDKIFEDPDMVSDSTDGTNFRIIREINKDMVVVSTPSIIMDTLIPENIEEYFFFDGERLREYFSKNSGEKIHDAVFKISQLETFMDAIDHLTKRKNYYRQQLDKLSPKAKEYGEKIEFLEKNLNDYKKDLEKLQADLIEAEAEEEEYDQKLKTCSYDEIERLQNGVNELDEDLLSLENDLKNNQIERFNYLLKMYPRILLYNEISYTQGLIAKSDSAGRIPPDITKEFVERIITEGHCICGSDISKDNECRHNIELFLKKTEDITNIGAELIEENVNFKKILRSLKNFRDKQVAYGKKNKQLNDTYNEKNVKLKEYKKLLENSDKEEIKHWNEKFNMWKKIRRELESDIVEHRYKIGSAEDEIERLERKWQKEVDKESKEKELKIIKKFYDTTLDAAEEISNTIMEDIRQEVERRTKLQFMNLIWKESLVNDVIIDENYNLTVLDQFGNNIKGALSAGETQLLALSFTAALNQVSGFDVPLIIDTPLGRLDREHRLNFAKKLPEYLEGKQIILLVTDAEYTKDVREELIENIGLEYKIDFKDVSKRNESVVTKYER